MLSVILPAYNEAAFLEAAVSELHAGLSTGEAFEILVVENGSSDDTAAVASRLAESLPAVRLLTRPEADYGAALRAGLLAASGDAWVVFNVDYWDLPFMHAALESIDRRCRGEGPALVVGSKRAPGASDRRGLVRRSATRVFTTLLKAAFDVGVSDTHGMKVLSAAPLRPVVERCTFGRDIFDTELVVRAERAGLGVVEIPVAAVETRPARTSFLGRVPRTLADLTRLHRLLAREERQERKAPSGSGRGHGGTGDGSVRGTP